MKRITDKVLEWKVGMVTLSVRKSPYSRGAIYGATDNAVWNQVGFEVYWLVKYEGWWWCEEFK
jgi:hypothetical protein